jgi:hypothetical protein
MNCLYHKYYCFKGNQVCFMNSLENKFRNLLLYIKVSFELSYIEQLKYNQCFDGL